MVAPAPRAHDAAMDTITEPHVNGGHDAPRRLRREPGGRIAGVCQGLGTYLGIDANVVRILFVLGAFAGGAGIAAYVAAWVLLPTSDDPSPEPLRLRVDGPVRAVVLALVALFAGWAFIGFLWAPWGFGPGRLAFGALLVAAGLIVLSRRGDGAPVAASAGVGGATSVVPPAPPAPPAPFLASWRNRASVALAGLLAAGGAVALAAALTGAFAPSLVELSGLVLAVLVVVPVAMVFLGLGRGVVALGALGALAGLAFCLPGPSFAHGAGQRDLVATTPSEL